jgi:hypothetical protein
MSRQSQVLRVQAHAKRLLRAMNGRGARSARRGAAAQRRDDLVQIEPAGARKGEALADRADEAGDDDLVRGLRGLAGAMGAEVRERAAHGPEQRPGALEDCRVAAHHDRERALARAFDAAADRRIEEVGAPGGEEGGDRARRGGGYRGVVDDSTPGRSAGSIA